MTRTAVLGGGMLGEALLAGLLRSGTASEDVVVVEARPERAEELRSRHGVETVPLSEAATADVLVVVVKPQDVGGLLSDLAPHLRDSQLVVSLAAGVPLAALERPLPAGVPVVRVMTNTPLLVGEAMSVVAGGTSAGEEHLAAVEDLLRPVGRVLRLPEDKLDAVTGLSGSGPAYVYLVVEALVDAGVMLGLPRATAHELAVQTLVGAGAMLRETGSHPVQLREAVTSPGGTTIRAVRALEDGGLRSALLAAVEASALRSAELAAGG